MNNSWCSGAAHMPAGVLFSVWCVCVCVLLRAFLVTLVSAYLGAHLETEAPSIQSNMETRITVLANVSAYDVRTLNPEAIP